MNALPWSEVKKLSLAKLQELAPVTILGDGTPAFFLDKVESVIVTSDLHPRVRNNLRAQEKRARVGMPPPVRPDYAPDWNKPTEETPKE